jgi:hypothetical protein
VGAPAGFSTGDQWTFPLVGPLEDGLLVTPASVRGHGPYLFAIDPDANVTALAEDVVQAAHLRVGLGPKRVDESDTGRNRFYAEMIDLEVGGLRIARRDAMVFSVGFYDTEGRHISGIIGRDVLADSLVFGFDRDQGIATLSTIKAFKPPPDAISIAYENLAGRDNNLSGKDPPQELIVHPTQGGSSVPGNPGRPWAAPVQAYVPARLQDKERFGVVLADVTPMPRRLASVRIGDASFEMHLDLGATVSQLREASWRKAKLTPVPAALHLVDEAMIARDVTSVGRSTSVVVGGIRSHATFAPYIEKRFLPAPVDGTLGLDFFQPYAVYANWDATAYLLRPRGDAAATTTARLGRWGSALPACPHPGCVTPALVASGAGVALEVVRDAEAANRDLEVLVSVAAVRDQPAMRLVVELPRALDRVAGVLPGDYREATASVLDAAPFPRDCDEGTGCVVLLGADAATRFEKPLPSPSWPADPARGGPGEPAREAPPATAIIGKLHRVTGELAIPPSAATVSAAGGVPVAVAIVKLCLTAEGKVDSTRLIKSSNLPAYDDQLQATIKATWSFEPVELDGKPIPVCTQVTFIPH